MEFEEEIKFEEEEEERNRLRPPPRHHKAGGNLDDLVDRIGRLNVEDREARAGYVSDGSPEDFNGDDGSISQSTNQAWAGMARIGTEAWPANVNNDYVPSPHTLPQIDRSKKPRSRIPSDSLRPVRVPANLVKLFGEAAKANTFDKNIETCGNLWGVRESGSYVVTHVLIPKQKGTDSYCEDLDEGTVAEFAITRDLIQLGWIHTHPSQTAFLSSVDMHMQVNLLLPEWWFFVLIL